MALADDLATLRPRKQSVVDVLAALDEADRTQLLATLADRRIHSTDIAATLNAHGYLMDSDDPAQRVRAYRAKMGAGEPRG